MTLVVTRRQTIPLMHDAYLFLNFQSEPPWLNISAVFAADLLYFVRKLPGSFYWLPRNRADP